ncbi:MAG: NAD(P)/FAD-dependent oxidoreductase [Candidatus Bathyarchaeia archaeon]
MSIADVVVVGAGPAGSSVAKVIGSAGFDVELIEQRKPCQTKVCGGVISAKLARELLFEKNIIEKFVSHEVLHFPWGKKIRRFHHATVKRQTFDTLLADNAARCGANINHETKATDAARKGDVVQVSLKSRKDKKTRSISCKMIVFADGPFTLGTKLFPTLGFKGTPNNLAIAARYELEWEENNMNHLELFFGHDISPWGFGWIFPRKDSLNVGVGCRLSTLRRFGIRITETLDNFIKDKAVSSETLIDKKVLHFGAAMLPLAPAERIYGPSSLVVGDAAGMVDPLGGYGIDNAVFAGRLAGHIAVEALQKGDFSENFLSRYQTLWKQSSAYSIIKRNYRIARALYPFLRIDKNLIAKIEYLLHYGLESVRHVDVILYPMFSKRGMSSFSTD